MPAAGVLGGIRPHSQPPASSRMQAPLTSFDAYHRGAGEVVGGQSNTGDVLSLIVPTHAQGVLPASMPAMPIIDADMIDASAPVFTPDTALVATSHPELVLPMHAGTCPTPAASDAGVTTAVTANPTTSASTAPRPHYVDIPKTDAYALSPDVSAIDLDRQPGADKNMHSIGEDFLGTSAPDVLQIGDVSAQSIELPYRRVRVPQLVAAQLQGTWADAVADALEYIRDAVKRRHHDSIAAGIQHLLMLATEVLGDNRGGSGQQRRAAARVRDLRKRARAASTRAEATRSDNTRGKAATVEEYALAGRIHRHVRNGNDGRAARCLDSSRMAVVDDAVMAQLKALHPPASSLVPPTVEDGPAGPAQVDADRVLGILQRLPQGTASGLSGWTYEHIRAAGLHSQRTRDAMRGFLNSTRLLNDLLSGDIPPCHLLLASRLIALEKPQGGVRPNAIGEAFLRLSSNCALSTAQNAEDLLAPLQIGVGISGGAEIPGHLLRPDFSNPDVVTVQVDLLNAFNLANRDDIVHAVADKLPSLLPYVLMAYQQQSPLVIQQADGSHEVLWSEAGVRQGDPMGPLLFALTYQPTPHAAQDHAADAIVTACHDDTYLQGQDDTVVAGARRIMSRHACQPRKTLMYCADPDKARNVAARFGATIATGGIVACGTALGSDAFIAQHIQQRCDGTCAQVDKLVGLPPDPQTKWSVLHNCLQHREAHLMRNTWWHLLAAPLRQVEDALVRGMCDIIGVTSLTDQQRVQVPLPHRHGGMGLRRFSEDVATAARLSSAALAHAALAGGFDKALPFRGAMGLEAHLSLARLQEAWPTVKGLADRPDDAAEWAGRKPDGKDLRMAALQRAFSQADADTRTAALFATLEADAKGASSQVRSAALADLTRLHSCAGSLASAWLTARPGQVELTAVEFCISARLRLGEDLFAGQDGDDACVCGRCMAASGTHSLICGALWHTVVARHNALTEAWLRLAACGGIAATRDPHVKQLPQRPHTMGLPALPTRPQPALSAGGHMPARASPIAPGIPHPTPASAVPSTLHGTQAPHPPVPSASAAPPTPGDAAAAGQSAPVALGEASAVAVPAAANVAAAPSAAAATAPAAVAPPPAPNPPPHPRCGNSRRPTQRRHWHDTAPATLPARPPAR